MLTELDSLAYKTIKVFYSKSQRVMLTTFLGLNSFGYNDLLEAYKTI